MSESTNYNDESGKDRWDNRTERQRSDGHIWTGIFILAVGAAGPGEIAWGCHAGLVVYPGKCW